MTDPAPEAGRFFDREAGLYDAAHDREDPRTSPLHVRMAAVLRLLGSRPATVLDCGMGPGRLLVKLDAHGWSVAGVDASAEMVERARARLPALADRLVQASVERLPFADETFDAAVCTGVLEYVADVPGALAEVARVLRPGGRFVVSMPNMHSPRTLWRHRVVYPSVRALKARLRFGRPVPLVRPGAVTLSRLEHALESAGLKVERVEYLALLVPSPLRRHVPDLGAAVARWVAGRGRRAGSLLATQFVVAARKREVQPAAPT